MIRTVARSNTFEQVILKSRFIALAHPIASAEEAIAGIEAARARDPQASHHCYAYVQGDNRSIQRYSDQGEPSGTAGLPILEAILRRDLTDVLIVVTRYFGGTLLGTGGLTRAYQTSALGALDGAGIVERRPAVVYRIAADYTFQSTLDRLFRENAKIEGTEYTDRVIWDVSLPLEAEVDFLTKLADVTRAQVVPEARREFMASWPVEEEE